MSLDAAALVAEIRRRGGDIRPIPPDRLRVTAPPALLGGLLARIRPLKPEILALFTQPRFAAASVGTWTAEDEERAAIVEYDGRVPRDWAEGLTQLTQGRRPGDVPPDRWQAFIDDCGRFLDGKWPEAATRLGWRALDLFGCDRYRPFARVDKAGLLWLLNGARIVAMCETSAVIETVSGARQTYRRRPNDSGNVALAWELEPGGYRRC